MRILFLSANKLGYELFLELQKIKHIEMIGIITLSKKASTKMYDPIDQHQSWHDFDCPVFEVEHINENYNLIKDLTPDLIIMCGWRQIINKDIINLPPKGFIGFHPTLLPYGRGPAPIINTILCGLEESGVTMFYVDEGTDTGDIIGQKKFDVNDTDYAMDIYNKIINEGKYLIKKYVPLIVAGKNPRVPQDESRSHVFPRRTIQDNKIDLIDDGPDLMTKKIRAFSKPYDGAFIELGKNKLVIWNAEIQHNDGN